MEEEKEIYNGGTEVLCLQFYADAEDMTDLGTTGGGA